MIHLRIVAPRDRVRQVVDLLRASPSVMNIAQLEGTFHKPEGELILCDVVRGDASVVISDLRELGIPETGSIAVEYVDTAISSAATEAEEAASGFSSDAVVWEEVEQRTSESTELSFSFVAFMAAAMQVAAVGILLDQPILIVAAMILGPEFGPLAGISVALVHGRGELARRSFVALAVGFPVGIVLCFVVTALFKVTGLAPDDFAPDAHPLTQFISKPDFFSVFIALVAGSAGVLSLTSAKSAALIGVLVSVTTIPAASNIGVGAAYGDWGEAGGAAAQLGINLGAIVVAGVVTLWLQRRYFIARRRAHLVDPIRDAAGLPLGRSARGTLEVPLYREDRPPE